MSNKYWKTKLSHPQGLGKIEILACLEAPDMDAAIKAARDNAPINQERAGEWAVEVQEFTDAEAAKPLETERRFLDSGEFSQ